MKFVVYFREIRNIKLVDFNKGENSVLVAFSHLGQQILPTKTHKNYFLNFFLHIEKKRPNVRNRLILYIVYCV